MKKIGLQMYSLKRYTADDLIGTLKNVAGIGVKGIEFAGYFGHSAKELKSVLADLGLQCAGSHVGWHMLDEDAGKLNEVIDYSAELGEPYIICPGLPGKMTDSRSAWLATADKFNKIGEKVAKAGMKFAFHNHSSEFEEFDGEYGLGILFNNTDPRYVRMELDTCWCDVTGKVKSVDFMKKHAAHLELLHIKEITAIGDPTAKMIGSGAMDFKAICALGHELGVTWYTIEHESEETDELEVIAGGVKYLESIL
jgi:sugar phosphate isomerase/epimerase